MTSELTGHDTDQPPENTETGLRADRDITHVEEHAGRNVGMTRAEAYAQLYGLTPGNSDTGSNTADGDSSSDNGHHHGNTSRDGTGNDQPEKPGTGHAGDSSPARQGQETDTGADQPARDADAREDTGTHDADHGDREATGPGSTGDRDTGLTPAAPSTEGTATRTPARPGPPDGAEATVPRPAERDRGQEDSARQHDDRAGDLDSGPITGPRRPTDGQDTNGRDGEDTGKHPQAGPENPGPAARHTDASDGETAETSSAEAPAQKQKDQPDGRNHVPDADPDQPGEVEAAPDRYADELRWAAMEQRMQAALDGMKADYESKVDTLQGTYELKVESLKAEHEAVMAQNHQEISDLKAELEQFRAERDRLASDGSAKDGRVPSFKPDAPPAGENENLSKPDVDPEPAHTRNKELDASGKAAQRESHEGDRPGWWSNAKAGLYGAVGSTVLLSAADQFVPGAPHTAIDLLVGGVTIAATAVPVKREMWRKRKHDD